VAALACVSAKALFHIRRAYLFFEFLLANYYRIPEFMVDIDFGSPAGFRRIETYFPQAVIVQRLLQKLDRSMGILDVPT